MVRQEDIRYMDVSPKQLVRSVATSLVPFLENHDANRALMGSNMQRQAVPRLKDGSPIGRDRNGGHRGAGFGGDGAVAKRDGLVEDVDASRIVIRADEDGLKEDDPGARYLHADQVQAIQPEYLHQSEAYCPYRRPGQKRRSDRGWASDRHGGTCTRKECARRLHALGWIQLRGFDPHQRKLLKEDTYTSIHIEELECVARDTKLGKEEITCDIPNVGEDALKDLDESGIVRIGAEVQPGDILVGKVTPKGETQLSPEEKLLRAIFGEKAGDVRDTSLRVPHGIEGIVIDAKVFSRKGQEKDERTKAIEDQEKARLLKNQADEIRIIQHSTRRKIGKYLIDKKSSEPDRGRKKEQGLSGGQRTDQRRASLLYPLRSFEGDQRHGGEEGSPGSASVS